MTYVGPKRGNTTREFARRIFRTIQKYIRISSVGYLAVFDPCSRYMRRNLGSGLNRISAQQPEGRAVPARENGAVIRMGECANAARHQWHRVNGTIVMP